MTPLVTLGLPVRNGAPLVRDALDSMLAQDCPNIEILVSDNASTDETASILREYQERHSNIRVITKPESVPAAENFFTLVREAKGEFFAWGAHDDLRSADFISKLLPAFDDDRVVLAFGDVWIWDGQGEPSKRSDFVFATQGLSLGRRLRKVARIQCYHLFGLWRTDTLRRIETAYRYTHWWSDMPIMLAAASLGTSVHIPGPRLIYREVVKSAKQRAAYQDNRSSVSRPLDVLSLIWASFESVRRLGIKHWGAAVLAATFISERWTTLVLQKLTGTGPYKHRAEAVRAEAVEMNAPDDAPRS